MNLIKPFSPELEPAYIVWSEWGCFAVYATDREWTAERRKDFEAWATVKPK